MHMNSSWRRYQSQHINSQKLLLEQAFQNAMSKFDDKPKQSSYNPVSSFAKNYSIKPAYNEHQNFSRYQNINSESSVKYGDGPYQYSDIRDQNKSNPLKYSVNSREVEPNYSTGINNFNSPSSFSRYSPNSSKQGSRYQPSSRESNTSMNNSVSLARSYLNSPSRRVDSYLSTPKESLSNFSPQTNASNYSSFLYSPSLEDPKKEQTTQETISDSPKKTSNSPTQEEIIRQNRELFWQRVLQRREREALLKQQQEQEKQNLQSTIQDREIENPTLPPTIQKQQNEKTTPSSAIQKNENEKPTLSYTKQTNDELKETSPATSNQQSIWPTSQFKEKNDRAKILDQAEKFNQEMHTAAAIDAEKILAEFQQRVFKSTQENLIKQAQINSDDDKNNSLNENNSLSEDHDIPLKDQLQTDMNESESENEMDLDIDIKLNEDEDIDITDDLKLLNIFKQENNLDEDEDENNFDIADDLEILNKIKQENLDENDQQIDSNSIFDEEDVLENQESSNSFIQEEPTTIQPSEFSEIINKAFTKDFFIKSKLEFMIEHTIEISDKFLSNILKNILYTK